MWPTKFETGVQLAYGVSGPGVVMPQHGPRSVTPTVVFSRLRRHAPRYRRMGNSTVALATADTQRNTHQWDTAAVVKRESPEAGREASIATVRDAPEPQMTATPVVTPASGSGPGAGIGRTTEQFPEYIVLSLEAEAAPLSGSDIHDPIHGPLATFFLCGTGAFGLLVVIEGQRRPVKSKSNVVEVQAVAWGAGETLQVQLLMPVNKRVERDRSSGPGRKGSRDGGAHGTTADVGDVGDTSDTSDTGDTSTDSDDGDDGDTSGLAGGGTHTKWKAVFPRHRAQCQVGVPVLQVEAWPQARVLAVRTAARIVLFSYHWNNDPGAKGLRLERRESHPGLFVHMSFGYDQLAAIDAAGAITVWKVDCRNTHAGDGASVPEPHELSHWRRVCWARAGELLVALRSSVSHVQLAGSTSSTPSVTTIVLARMWSRIQDLHVVPGTRHAFVLTTKEVMWCEIGAAPLRRLVSWKHYLDDTDALVRMAVARDGPGYVCAVHSCHMPLVLVYSFAEVDGRPCSARDPYFVPAPALSHLALAPLPFSGPRDRLLNLVECTASGAWFLVLRPGLMRFRVPDGATSAPLHSPFPSSMPSSMPSSTSRISSPVYLYTDVAHQLFDALTSPAPLPHESSALDVEGALASHPPEVLGQQPQWHSVTPPDAAPVCVTRRKTFDDMVHRLQSDSPALGLAVENLIPTLIAPAERAAHHISHPVNSAATLARALTKYSRDRLNIRHATMLLATSLVRVAPADAAVRLEQALHEAYDAVPPLLQAVFDDWGDEPRAAPPKKRKRDLRHLAISHSQASQHEPQLSQSPMAPGLQPIRTASMALSQLAQAPSQPSQPSQIVPSQSQSKGITLSQKSSQRGKKKKRKGGFA